MLYLCVFCVFAGVFPLPHRDHPHVRGAEPQQGRVESSRRRPRGQDAGYRRREEKAGRRRRRWVLVFEIQDPSFCVLTITCHLTVFSHLLLSQLKKAGSQRPALSARPPGTIEAVMNVCLDVYLCVSVCMSMCSQMRELCKIPKLLFLYTVMFSSLIWFRKLF